jgi:hypothetical protein
MSPRRKTAGRRVEPWRGVILAAVRAEVERWLEEHE